MVWVEGGISFEVKYVIYVKRYIKCPPKFMIIGTYILRKMRFKILELGLTYIKPLAYTRYLAKMATNSHFS